MHLYAPPYHLQNIFVQRLGKTQREVNAAMAKAVVTLNHGVVVPHIAFTTIHCHQFEPPPRFPGYLSPMSYVNHPTDPDQGNNREADQTVVQAAVGSDAGADGRPVQASQVRHGVALRLLASGMFVCFWRKIRVFVGKVNQSIAKLAGCT